MRVLLIAFVSALTLISNALAGSVNDPNLVVQSMIASGGSLSYPTGIVFVGSNDLLAIEKNTGLVRRITSGVLAATPVLDLAVNNYVERGLLGIALPPDFSSNHEVFLYWTQATGSTDTDASGDVVANRVTRYTWNGSALVSPVSILTLPVLPGPNHNSGYMTFGPDGKLYIQTGDLNRNGQMQNYPDGPAPDSTSAILRVNPDGTSPSDNPFYAEGGALGPVYAYGIRNSFGMAFDPVTHTLWQSENGPNDYDEVNVAAPGWNSGWEQIMGPDARDPQGQGDLWFPSPAAFYSDPEFSWLNTVCVTAVGFPHVAGLGDDYSDALLIGDCDDGRIFRFHLNATRDGFTFTDPGLDDLVGDNETEMQELVWGTGFATITDMKSAPDGSLYVLDWAGLWRIYDPSVLDSTGPIPPAAALTSAPNPFTDRTTVRVAMARSGRASLAIFDVSGRLVRRLYEGPIEEGVRTFTWDGRNEEERHVASGVYHLRLSQDGRTLSHRVVRVR